MVRRLTLIASLAFVTVSANACGDDDLAGGVSDVSDADATPDGTADATAEETRETVPDTAEILADITPDSADAADAADAATEVDDSPLGGDRPAKLVLPPSYTPGTAYPLVILLHGYSVTGEIQDLYLGLSPAASAKAIISVVPDGTRNATGTSFWNASPGWCCDFGNSGVDDAGYILGLVAEAKARFTIDPARVYLVGHSNGGFMSYKLACEHADVFAAMVSIAGSMPLDAADCAPSEPVSVLQVHGTIDATIAFGGVPGQFPSAEEVVKRWAGHDDCEHLPANDPVVDYDNAVLGDETHPQPYPGCTAGTAVALWRLDGSGHIPTFTPAFMPAALDWLLAHPKSR